MSLPTSVEPVKATLRTSGCDTTSEPVLPAPVTMLTTPGGRSACSQISAKSRADSEVVSAGLSDLGQRLFGGGVQRPEVLARVGRDELAADVELVPGCDGDDVAGLGRGHVLPLEAGKLRRRPRGQCHLPVSRS